MKTILRIIISVSLVLISLFLLGSCKSLRKPENLTVDFWEASWGTVEGAEEYVVELDGKEYRTKDTTFELFEFVYPGEQAKIRVEPVFVLGAREGLWTDEITYTAESVTEGLVYTKLSDGTYAVSCPEELELENGELVLPETYNDCAVVEFRNAINDTYLLPLISNGKESTYNGPEATKISKVRLPNCLNTIEIGAFYKATIEKIHIPKTVLVIHDYAFERCVKLTEIRNAKGIRAIHEYAFSGCSALKEFPFSENLSTIFQSAFVGAGLTRVNLPDGLEHLLSYTFYNCTSLTEISLPKSIRAVFPECFDNTGWYNEQPDGPLYLDHVLYGYKGEMPENTKLVIPETVTILLENGVLKNQKNLISLTFLGDVKRIPQNAFSGCENLEEVILPESLEGIVGGAFYNCGFKSFKLPEGLKSITGGAQFDGGVFEGCKNLREIVIPENVTYLGNRCFYDCTNLEKITIESNVLEKIESDAFLYCTSLTELSIPDSVKEFEFNSIAYSGITHFVFPENVKRNPYYVPKYQDGILLDYVVIQKRPAIIDYNWFYIYPNLHTFYYEGTEEDYQKVQKHTQAQSSFAGSTKQEAIDEWASELTVYFYSETKPAKEGNYWHYVNGIPAVWYNNI